ncbi:DUF680 domain-containing protein [Mesorhizobium sp. M0179]|uniref:hypothetical protein n=1 Tax=unclassified Mesorhizobium TaxID=325217 RepID=UPI0003CF9333|nr:MULTISPECIES: hypothetical protein [unclassified Mesorhizobium]ESX13450.1 hypothetical protein X768_04200 [Mesorhizobium sp. LSJC265A00]ESY07742.1 hypothetical protein X753_02790 [Mesorhizobium sp. LNJC399B00]WJI71055.1 DUF680 domain-containing protein [Mesorhizobium sp. C399B]
MNKTLLALTAVLALSGSAFAANNTHSIKQAPAATCVDTTTNAKLDCAVTGSVEKSDVKPKSPRLGIEINPWIVPSTF